jgi:hypothetical protein
MKKYTGRITPVFEITGDTTTIKWIKVMCHERYNYSRPISQMFWVTNRNAQKIMPGYLFPVDIEHHCKDAKLLIDMTDTQIEYMIKNSCGGGSCFDYSDDDKESSYVAGKMKMIKAEGLISVLMRYPAFYNSACSITKISSPRATKTICEAMYWSNGAFCIGSVAFSDVESTDIPLLTSMAIPSMTVDYRLTCMINLSTNARAAWLKWYNQYVMGPIQ